MDVVRAVMNMYEKTRAIIVIDDEIRSIFIHFEMGVGVQQGSVLSRPLLFICVMDVLRDGVPSKKVICTR